MTRRRQFREMETIATLLMQPGTVIICKRCGLPITMEDVKGGNVQKEHLHEVELGGADEPFNCIFSHTPCHRAITTGTGATTAGSSIGRIAKTKRIERTGKMAVKRPELVCTQIVSKESIGAELTAAKRSWPARKLVNRVNPWPPRGSRLFNKPRRA